MLEISGDVVILVVYAITMAVTSVAFYIYLLKTPLQSQDSNSNAQQPKDDPDPTEQKTEEHENKTLGLEEIINCRHKELEPVKDNFYRCAKCATVFSFTPEEMKKFGYEKVTGYER